jgi:CRP/FNR family cyclic AMP-dependent transcriptional regulator
MMNRIPKEVLDDLRKVPLFANCTKDELREIVRLGTEAHVPDGRVLTEQGKPGSEFFLIRSGQVRCLVDGKEVALLGGGDFFGEMALLDKGPRHATVVADGPADLIVLDRREFSSLLDASPSITKRLLYSFAARQRANVSVQA